MTPDRKAKPAHVDRTAAQGGRTAVHAGRTIARRLLHIVRSVVYYGVAVPVLYLVCKVWFGYRVVGEPRFACKRGGCIVVSNHVHYLDCVLVALAALPRRMRFLVDRCNYDHPVLGVFMRLFECVPTGGTIAQVKAMIHGARAVVGAGEPLAVYPEGRLVCYREGLAPFHRGAFDAALAEGVPVVPVVLAQNGRAWGLCRLFGKPGFTVVRGRPIQPPDKGLARREREELLEATVRGAMHDMLARFAR